MVQGITGICKSLCRYLCNRSLVGGGGGGKTFSWQRAQLRTSGHLEMNWKASLLLVEWQVILLSLATPDPSPSCSILSSSCIALYKRRKKCLPILGNIKVNERNCFHFDAINQMLCLLSTKNEKKKKNTPTPWGFGFQEMSVLSMEPKDH